MRGADGSERRFVARTVLCAAVEQEIFAAESLLLNLNVYKISSSSSGGFN
jgi:hypothetical protein